MWLEKYKSNGAITNKIKMLKTFNCLSLDILALMDMFQMFFLCFKTVIVTFIC